MRIFAPGNSFFAASFQEMLMWQREFSDSFVHKEPSVTTSTFDRDKR